MELIDHWRNYLRDFPSPDSYIEWTFYSMIASALQRRVWTGPEHAPIFPNLFVALIGPPATGKGLPTNKVKELLRHHLMYPRRVTQEQADLLNKTTSDVDTEAMMNLKKLTNPPLLFPCGADKTTTESLTEELAQATRSLRYCKPGSDKATETYFHCSTSFILSEMSNLFRKKAEEVVQMLQELYDCNQHFRYRTKHQGEDIIQNACVNILACSTEDFLQDCFKSNLLRQGIASRTHFIFETGPRFRRYDIPELDESQKDSLARIVKRLLELSKLYGNVKQTEECHDLAKTYFEQELDKKRNPNPKLDDYYGRFRYHMDKVAMAIHFSDSDSMTMERSSMEKSIYALERVEVKMHFALASNGLNQYAAVSRKIVDLLKAKGEKTEGELLLEFYEDVDGMQKLVQILTDLLNMGVIERRISIEGKPGKWKIREGNTKITPKQHLSTAERINEITKKYDFPKEQENS